MEASLRRSPRLQQLRAASSNIKSSEKEGHGTGSTPKASTKRPRHKTRQPVKPKKKRSDRVKPVNDAQGAIEIDKDSCLPRTREMELLDENAVSWVMGIDEAGRGPLAGPVVAAAALVTQNIEGVEDSKKLTKEDRREELYEQIVSSPNVHWAVAVVDAPRIDEINILQATLQGMRMAATALIDPKSCNERGVQKASATEEGCFVVCGQTNGKGEPVSVCRSKAGWKDRSAWYALVDGNRVPKDMPCDAESLVKGDSREYSIAAASILAKVTRDRLMREYDAMYPQYQLAKHKGYPTAAHMEAVRTHGASPIHRRTFAPLKHMVFDENGGVIEKDEDKL